MSNPDNISTNNIIQTEQVMLSSIFMNVTTQRIGHELERTWKGICEGLDRGKGKGTWHNTILISKR